MAGTATTRNALSPEDLAAIAAAPPTATPTALARELGLSLDAARAGTRTTTATSWPMWSSRAATWRWRWGAPRTRCTGGDTCCGGGWRRRPGRRCGGSGGASGYNSGDHVGGVDGSPEPPPVL